MRHMLQKDPSHRLTAEEYLVKQRGKAFPDVFYTCLKMYQQQFAVSPIIPPDDRILWYSCSYISWILLKQHEQANSNVCFSHKVDINCNMILSCAQEWVFLFTHICF